jgi:hypothetical protein
LCQFIFQLQDGAVEPFEQGFFSRFAVALFLQGGNCFALGIERDVMARDIFLQVLVGDELPQKAIAARMAPHGLPDIDAGDGVTKQLFRLPWGAHGAPVAYIPEDAPFLLQLLDHVPKIVSHASLLAPRPMAP